MLSGFNTNFRYRGVLFHVQTEDSGLENPHVITHLFHGGNIMASEKRDYSDLVASEASDALETAIRKMMEGQHKAMLKGLSRGEHDAVIEQRMGPDVFRVADPSATSSPTPVTEEERPPAQPPEGLAVTPASAPPSQAMAEPTRIDAPPAPPPMAPASERSTAEETQPVSRLSRVFGDRVVSEKPLDEVVLDYLVENARKKKKRTLT